MSATYLLHAKISMDDRGRPRIEWPEMPLPAQVKCLGRGPAVTRNLH